MDRKVTYGEYLKQKRLERGITSRVLSEKIGISPEHCCNIEKNRKPAPKVKVLYKIVEVLKLSKENQK